MKKSDKLLLGGFLAGLLLLSAIHITLYAKYKTGNYTLYNEQENMAAAMQSFPNIMIVSVRNVHGATVRFGDVAAVEKGDEDYLHYVQKGDTLLITGKTNPNVDNGWNDVDINLPRNVTLSAFNSSLFFRNSKNSTEPNCAIQLQKSSITLSGTEAPFRLGNVNVVASDSSTVAFRGNMHVNDLDVKLSNSSIEYNDGAIGRLTIQTDSASRISLQAKHLVKASIRPITSQ